MSRIYTDDAEYLRVQTSSVAGRQPIVEVQHHYRGAQGEVEDWWIQLSPKDARRLAKQLRKATRSIARTAGATA